MESRSRGQKGRTILGSKMVLFACQRELLNNTHTNTQIHSVKEKDRTWNFICWTTVPQKKVLILWYKKKKKKMLEKQ